MGARSKVAFPCTAMSATWERWALAPFLLSQTQVASACQWVCSLWSLIYLWKVLPFWVKWEIHIFPKNHTCTYPPMYIHTYIYIHTNLLPLYIKSAFPPTHLDLCHRPFYFYKAKLLLQSRVVKKSHCSYVFVFHFSDKRKLNNLLKHLTFGLPELYVLCMTLYF